MGGGALAKAGGLVGNGALETKGREPRKDLGGGVGTWAKPLGVNSQVILRNPKRLAALPCPPPRPTTHMVLLFQASSPGRLPLGAF